MYWYEKETDCKSPVLSTRVRFARNLEKTPFPERLSEKGRQAVFEKVKNALENRKTLAVDFGTCEDAVKEAYVQTHLASAQLLKRGRGCGLILSEDGNISVMVNEEDHIRLQAISAGLALRETFAYALEWEKELEEKLPVLFDETLGYLTACPTNLGAAMRASVMLHLPCVKTTGRMNSLIRALNDAGFTVRGLFGEGSEGSGAIYQISNQMSKDKTPEEIISAMEKVVENVAHEESKARERLLQKDRGAIENEICRALGTLKYARKISYAEFISLYSLVRLGKETGLPEAKELKNLDRLLIEMMPAPLLLKNAALSDAAARDEFRSAEIKKNFS